MAQFFSLRARPLVRAVALILVLLAGLGLRPQAAWASHLRAGDIQAKVDTTAAHDPRRIFFKMILYTDNGSAVKQPTATIFFGDGTSSCDGGVPRFGGERVIPGSPDTSINIYYFEHYYGTVGSFIVSFIGENRNAGVLNMDASASQSFYISTTVSINPDFGLNHSPVLRAPAVDKGAVNQVFLHNPAAYDADGDSLHFELRQCQQVPQLAGTIVGAPCAGATGNNRPVPQICPNYRYPADLSVTPATFPVQVAYAPGTTGLPVGVAGAQAIFQINPNTGQIIWNAPDENGIYNVALVVREIRRTPGGSVVLSETIRDMQIIISATNNQRPTLNIPPDLCVVAGQTATGTVTATDGITASSPQTPVTLFAYSGIIPPATFTQTLTGPPVAQGTFNWLTDCSNVAEQPYVVVFKAQDGPSPPTTSNPILIDEKPWNIRVVGPPPQNLRATSVVGTGGNPNSVTLNWNTYVCANASRMYIYRKVGPSSFVPSACVTRIPPSAGYTLVSSVPANITTFTDNNVSSTGTVLGLDRGQTYCYRIYAEFQQPKGGASIASAEACASFPGRAAMLTNVDVEATSTTAGRITVRWTQPRTAPGGAFEGAPSYVLSRAEGLTPGPFTQVRAFSAITDTSFVDSGLNTQDVQYTYKLEFVRTFAAGDPRTPVREASPTASSVRTNAVPAGLTAITVSWTHNVPWDNSGQPVNIYRRGPTGGAYVQVGTATNTATGGSYADRDPVLQKDQTYCYYVQTTGRYGFPDPRMNIGPLLNKSQERCVLLTTPPCTPVLALQPTNCDSLASLQEFPTLNQSYTNRLRWNLSNNPGGCDARIASYKVFYRPTPTGAFTLLGTTTQTSYVHSGLAFSGGCYAVQAVAPSGVVSDTSNVACQDNCLFFKLPNIFTPNGDNQNAVFRPKNSSPVRRIHFQAFNRWGVKVFENTTTANDPVLINWDGGGPVAESVSGQKVSDGIYYYLAEVEFADFANTKRTYKGWVEIVR